MSCFIPPLPLLTAVMRAVYVKGVLCAALSVTRRSAWHAAPNTLSRRLRRLRKAEEDSTALYAFAADALEFALDLDLDLASFPRAVLASLPLRRAMAPWANETNACGVNKCQIYIEKLNHDRFHVKCHYSGSALSAL